LRFFTLNNACACAQLPFPVPNVHIAMPAIRYRCRVCELRCYVLRYVLRSAFLLLRFVVTFMRVGCGYLLPLRVLALRGLLRTAFTLYARLALPRLRSVTRLPRFVRSLRLFGSRSLPCVPGYALRLPLYAQRCSVSHTAVTFAFYRSCLVVTFTLVPAPRFLPLPFPLPVALIARSLLRVYHRSLPVTTATFTLLCAQFIGWLLPDCWVTVGTFHWLLALLCLYRLDCYAFCDTRPRTRSVTRCLPRCTATLVSRTLRCSLCAVTWITRIAVDLQLHFALPLCPRVPFTREITAVTLRLLLLH